MEKLLVWDDSEERFRIVVADDKLSVTLMFLNPGPDSAIGSRVFRSLTQMGIRHGLEMAALEAVLASPRVLIPYPIAHGTPAEIGKPGSWEILLSPEEGLIPQEQKDGSVDFRRVRRFREVEAGQPLVRHRPPGPGTPGVNCFGELVLPPKPIDPPWILGPGTCFAPDNSELVISSERGVLVRRDGTLAVEDHLEIVGSVDYETGDVEVSVPILINGDVKPGFVVRSDKNVVVRGSVQSARLEVGGDLSVRGGILGEPPSEIFVQGNIKAAHLHNARVHCKGSVEIRRSTVGCVVNCSGRFEAGEKLVGTHMIVESEVVAGTIGSELGSHSHVHVGLSAALREFLFPLYAGRLDLQRMLSEMDSEKKKLLRTVQEQTVTRAGTVQTKIPGDAIENAALRALLERQQVVEGELSKLDSREAELFREASPSLHPGAQIRVLRSVLVGTILAVGKEKGKILNPLNGVHSFTEAEICRGRLNVLVVGEKEFQTQLLKWAQRAGLWSLRLFTPDEPWVKSFRASLPEFVFLEGGEESSMNAWRTLKQLAAAPGSEEILFLLFGYGKKPDEAQETSLQNMIWVPEPVNFSTLSHVGKTIGLKVE